MSDQKRSDEVPRSEPKRRKITRVSHRPSNLNESFGKQTIETAPAIAEPCGVIERIILRNVLCHEHLDFDGFKSHVNLLMGANGSGKSSIVAAIIAGLGGSSKATDRAKNLQSLIQTGKNWASIEIHLKNKGIRAYEPEVFGDKVIVERRITSSSGGSYKIKDDNGKVISTKKEDLTHILDWYNFLVDNPVIVLSQERAKTFLSNTNPKKLFEFYMTATQLRQLSNEIKTTENNWILSNRLVELKLENLPLLNKELKELGKRVEALNMLEQNGRNLEELLRRIHWAGVIEQENEANTIQSKVREIEKALELSSNKLKKVLDQDKALQEESKDLNQKIITLAKEQATCESEFETSNNQQATAKRLLRAAKMEKMQLQKDLLQRSKDVDILKVKLTKSTNDATAEWENCTAKLETKRKEIGERSAAMDQCLKTEQIHRQNLELSLAEKEADLDQRRLEEKALSSQLGKLSRDLNNLSKTTDNLTVYGQFMPRLLTAIENGFAKGLFRENPVGPIGKHVKVKRQEWLHIVDKVALTMLPSFVVSCRPDYERLSQIFTQVIPNKADFPRITVSPFRNKVHNVSQFEVVSETYFSMWSVVETDNVQVANTLLDQLQMESLLLIPTADEANDLLIDARRVPRHCKKAMTLNGDTYFPDPNFKVYSGSGDKRARYLQTCVQDNIRNLRANFTQTNLAVEETRREIKELQKEVTALKAEIQKCSKKEHQYKMEMNKCRMEDIELQNKEIPPPPDVYQLKKDLEENEKLKWTLEQEINKLEVVFHERGRELKEAESRVARAKEENEKLSRSVFKLRDDSSGVQNKLHRVKRMLNVLEEEKKRLEEEERDLSQRLADKEELVRVLTVKVTEKYPERVESIKSKKELERDYFAQQKAIEAEKAKHGDVKRISQEWTDKKQNFEKIKKDIESQRSFICKMRESVEERRKYFKAIRKLMSECVKQTFEEMIKRRKLTGFMKISYSDESLEIMMGKDTGEKESQSQTLQMCSGGERSFATVSFILALWDLVYSPIRIMDEFDIFMDVVSRNQSVDMVIESIKQNMQYILVSPQEFQTKSKCLNVLKLPDPERKT